MGNSIKVTDVCKSFGSTLALDHVSLTLEPGHIYGLLGRNGAGKSTLLNLITNRLYPDQGAVTIDGMACADNDRALGRVYLMSEQNYYPESMRVSDAMRWIGSFYKDFSRPHAEELARQFGLPMKKKIKALSTGYSSIFKIILGLASGAPYLLLDEPVLGLDANHRQLFYRHLLQDFAENPRCIVISTHLIEEVARVIEQVIIIQEGRLLWDGSTESLLRRSCCVTGPAAGVDAFVQGRRVLSRESLGGLKSCVLLEAPPPAELPQGLELSAPDLQQLFISMTNEGGASL